VSLSHTCECGYDTRACWSHTVWKSHSACRNHTRACQNHTHAYRNHIRACENHTMRAEITLVRVLAKIYLKNWHSCVLISHANVSFSHVCVSIFLIFFIFFHFESSCHFKFYYWATFFKKIWTYMSYFELIFLHFEKLRHFVFFQKIN
jgi:hypothetical protein